MLEYFGTVKRYYIQLWKLQVCTIKDEDVLAIY